MRNEVAIATVRQPLDGGVSFLEAWNEALSRGGTSRTLGWQTLQAEGLASNRAGRLVVSGRTAPGTGQAFAVLEVNPINGFVDTAPGLLTIEAVSPGARLANVRVLASGVHPVALVEDPPQRRARVFRLSGNEPTGVELSSSGTNPTMRGQDLLELPANRLAVVTRCGGGGSQCVSGGIQGAAATPISWWTQIPYDPVGASLQTPNQLIPFSQLGPGGPARLGTDGAGLFVAGEDSAGNLVIQRWAANPPNILVGSWSSTAPMTPIDIVPSPTGSGVLVLAKTGFANAFNGQTLSFTPGHQSNVVLIYADAINARAVSWDLPGDQNPVGLATAQIPGGQRANDPVIIIGNQGGSGFIWRVPQP